MNKYTPVVVLTFICCTHVCDTLSVTVCDVGLFMGGAVYTIGTCFLAY